MVKRMKRKSWKNEKEDTLNFMDKTLKNLYLPLLISLFFPSHAQSRQQEAMHDILSFKTDNSAECVLGNRAAFERQEPEAVVDTENKRTLNEIRFENWSEKDWYDNDYFRALRDYLDAVSIGEVECKDLMPYSIILNGKFVVGRSAPFMGGGLFISFIFLDRPDVIFGAWVYSFVDESSETVCGYEVRRVWVKEENVGVTKEEILSIVRGHPENKLW